MCANCKNHNFIPFATNNHKKRLIYSEMIWTLNGSILTIRSMIRSLFYFLVLLVNKFCEYKIDWIFKCKFYGFGSMCKLFSCHIFRAVRLLINAILSFALSFSLKWLYFFNRIALNIQILKKMAIYWWFNIKFAAISNPLISFRAILGDWIF